MDPVELDVVARVGDHGELVRAEQVIQAGRELRAAGAAGQDYDDQMTAMPSAGLSSVMRRGATAAIW